jgi:hypothetical protein
MMCRRVRFHRHHIPRKLGEKADNPAACELARDPNLAVRVDGVNLKDLLRQIEPNARDRAQFLNRLAMDGFPSDGVSTATILAR